jgi:predicted metal-dependent phosphotriesterase family hydrolase
MKIIFRGVPFLLLLLLDSCLSKESPQVMTVAGPIPPADMGITLVHEHILVDFIGPDSTGYHRWNRQEVIEKALPYLEEVRSLGLSTFVDAFIWTHAQAGTTEGRIKAAGMSAWISLDNINHGQLDADLGYLQEMKSGGLFNRVLISHDSGWYSAGEKDGGTFRGYTVIFREFLPLLRQNGFSEQEINRLLAENPAQAFTIHSIKSSNP